MRKYLSLIVLAVVALGALATVVKAGPSPTATATLLNQPQYGGYVTVRVTIEGHVKFPAGVVWCSQYVGATRTYWGYWEHHYSQYQKRMDVTRDYGPLMTPSPDGTVLNGQWNPALPAACSFTVFAESQGPNGKGPFVIDGGWVPFTVPARVPGVTAN